VSLGLRFIQKAAAFGDSDAIQYLEEHRNLYSFPGFTKVLLRRRRTVSEFVSFVLVWSSIFLFDRFSPFFKRGCS